MNITSFCVNTSFAILCGYFAITLGSTSFSQIKFWLKGLLRLFPPYSWNPSMIHHRITQQISTTDAWERRLFTLTLSGTSWRSFWFRLGRMTRVIPERWAAMIFSLIPPTCQQQQQGTDLIHCGLVMPFGDIDLDQHWLRWWLDAWRHDGMKPLPESISTYHQMCSVAFIWQQSNKKCSWTYVLRLHFWNYNHIYQGYKYILSVEGFESWRQNHKIIYRSSYTFKTASIHEIRLY